MASLILRFHQWFYVQHLTGKLNLCIIQDEAKTLFGKDHANPTFKDVVSKLRESGISLVVFDQVVSELAQYIRSNSGTLVWLRNSDGRDVDTLRQAAGATWEQTQENYSLSPGQAIVRHPRARDLQKVIIPFSPVDKHISPEEPDRLMAPRLKELYKDVIPCEESNRPESAQREKERTPSDAKTDPNRARTSAQLEIDSSERRFLHCLAHNFDRPCTEVYEELGLGRSAGHALKERLRKKGFLSQLRTNLGAKGRRCVFLIPNPFLFGEFGIELPSGKGGPLHRHMQSELKKRIEQLGFVTVIEQSINGSPEACDLGLDRNGTKIAIEIVVTSRPAQEVAHIQKNLDAGFDHVVLSFLNSKVLGKTRELAASRYPKETLDKVSFCIVNKILEVLRGM